MKEKIPQHSHCSNCRKAFIGDGKYCSSECKNEGEENLKKRKYNLIILYVLTLVILTVTVIFMGLG